jgi:hypothetical protein
VDQEKFQSVQYVQGENRAMLQANLPQFKRLTILLDEEQYYEIENPNPIWEYLYPFKSDISFHNTPNYACCNSIMIFLINLSIVPTI